MNISARDENKNLQMITDCCYQYSPLLCAKLLLWSVCSFTNTLNEYLEMWSKPVVHLFIMLFSYMRSLEYRVVRNQYSWLFFTSEFALICGCKNNHRISCHNASSSHSHDVIHQLWWHPSAKLERLSLATMAKWAIADCFLAELCVQDIK